MKKKLFFLFVALLFSNCSVKTEKELVCIQLLDRNGVVETISFDERLKSYENRNFLSSQPYKKVVRVFSKNKFGHSSSIITSYHPNGLIWQYLEVVDGRAYGLFKEWYDNGKLKIEAQVIGGEGDLSLSAQNSWLFEGNSLYFGSNGNLKTIFQYKNGLLEGLTTQYYENGVIKKIIPFSHGKKEGEEKRFSPKGEFLAKTSYKQDLKNGESVVYWKDEKLKSLEEYENGKLSLGKYFNTKKKMAAMVENGTGIKATFHKRKINKLIEFKNGMPEGKVKEKKDGKLTRVYFQKNAMPHGEELLFYPDGKTPKLSITWKEGKIHGIVKSWYDNGQLESQREMAGNKKNGSFFGWNRDGSMMFSEEYDDDLLKKGNYYKLGQIVSTITNGSGIAAFYDEKGILIKRIKYKNSQIAE